MFPTFIFLIISHMHYGGAHLRVSGIKEGPRASGKSKRRPAHSFDRTVSVPHVRIPIAEPSGDYSESLKPRYRSIPRNDTIAIKCGPSASVLSNFFLNHSRVSFRPHLFRLLFALGFFCIAHRNTHSILTTWNRLCSLPRDFI